MGHTQLQNVVKSGGDAARRSGSGFAQTQKLALAADAGIFVHGQITDVQLIDDGIVERCAPMGISIRIPPFGVGGGKIDNHGPLAVNPSGSGVGIAGFGGVVSDPNGEGIIDAVQISLLQRFPCATGSALHRHRFQQVVRSGRTATVEIHNCLIGSGCPEAKRGLFRRPARAKIMAAVGVGGLKFRR